MNKLLTIAGVALAASLLVMSATPNAEPVNAVTTTASAAQQDSQAKNPVWVIESESNRTYLLGSIHVLRDQDYPLPKAFQAAYDDAEQLVMELDFTDLDAVSTFSTTRRLAMLPSSESLRSVMGEANYSLADTAAKEIGVDLEQFARVDPWYAAMTITQLQLGRLGFKAENGIELHFAKQAKRDAKSGSGLETIEEQLGILDALPIESQSQFLLESLVDMAELKEEGEHMIKAWKSGNAEQLHELFAEDLENNPDLHDALLIKRNMAWLPRIIDMTSQKDDYLVVVGALHLVGNEGVVELLRERGYTVRQL
ncbi:MAG: TraB/GumN family protein [Gammaproteobacteria bacterium]